MEVLNSIGQYISPYLREISTALVACILVMAGNEVNAFLRKVMRNQHFIVKTVVFIILNAFGYGFIIVKLSPYLARTLRELEKGMMVAILLTSFILIGLWAQKNRHI
ncbi:DUF3392 domain-containing protein [Vibrio salinus]|uniref:DUF3392 domain-containing protein n=1 Tax=Vibrio salinus TaxID=2899784 RepID=UPI001E53F5E6|nr:DUF3392 domain-containing protein [Vibrio salinus]MCE0492679.1 DUF3392 domain-containing protein [Vibrio salinus]